MIIFVDEETDCANIDWDAIRERIKRPLSLPQSVIAHVDHSHPAITGFFNLIKEVKELYENQIPQDDRY